MANIRTLPPLASNDVQMLNEHITHLNNILVDLATELARLQGLDDATPQINKHVNLQQNRITNAAPSLNDNDYVTRGELKRLGIYPKKDDRPRGVA